MAKEGLTLTPPTGSAIDLNGTKWGLEALAIGQPARREDLISSIDADGGLPARVSPRDVREVTATIRLLDAANMDAALNSIADVEKILESAERLAASNPTNPVTDLVRLVYTPAGATLSYSLIVLAADVSEIPREMSGDGAGFFIARPVVTIKAICDPYAYGTSGSTSPFTSTYLDATTSGGTFADSVTVAGGVGDVSPWLRLKIKDVDSKNRSRVIAGVRQGEGSTTASIAAAGLTAVVGTVASGTVTTTSTDWVVSAALPRQTRVGSFRAYLADARSTATGGGSVRLTTAEAGGSRRTGPTATVTQAGRIDAYLGEVVVDSSWDGWIETNGSVLYAAIILVPTDSFVEVTGASPGRQLTGVTTLIDNLNTTSANIGGRSLPTGTGTWTYGGTGWPVSAADNARRTAVSTVTPAIATAGSVNFIELDLRWTTRTTRASGGTFLDNSVVTGAVARHSDDSNFLWAGFMPYGGFFDGRPYVIKRVAGNYLTLWQGETVPFAMLGLDFDWNLQLTADGRWYVSVTRQNDTSLTAYGQDADLVSGGALGDASDAKVGLIDQYILATPAVTRDLLNFKVSNLVGVTPAPVTSGGTLTLAGPKMVNEDAAEYPYIGSSGIKIRPGVNNNLTVLTRRSSGYFPTGLGTTDPLDLDVDGYPRFISVPHT